MKRVATALRLITSLVVLTSARIVMAAPATVPATEPGVLEVSVSSAATPEPALKYHLTPHLDELTPGDAAPVYLMAFLQLHLTGNEQQQIADLLAAPRENFKLDVAKQIVNSRAAYFTNLDLAAHRDRCHWEIPFREQGFATRLPHLQPCRDAARLLSLRTRVQMLEGHFDEAVRTLEIGFALVEQLKNDAVLVQGLVALAMSNMLLDRVAELTRTPGGPNLYWALAELPRPLVDMRALADMERSWGGFTLGLMLPEIKGRSLRELSPEEVNGIIARLRRLIALMNGEGVGIDGQLRFALVMAKAVGPARAWLTSHGYTDKQAQEMPVEQSVGIYFFESYQQISDDLNKWMSVPYWQSRKGIAKGEAARAASISGDNPLTMMMPAMSTTYQRIAKTEQRIAVLQTIEAIRAYAATHDGKLPPSLADLSETPAPIDPLSGKTFEYEVSASTAMLTLADRDGTDGKHGAVYRIRIAMGR